ncbi:hypothetical protein L195_g014127, partial [Trifolium pratense]
SYSSSMENSDEETDGISGNHAPKELTRLSSNGAKFVDEVLNGPNQRCLDNFRMDKQDCVGAIDGIYVPVTVGVDEQGPFRNKDGLLSQNILAACSFDLKFCYVLAGWEGSATNLQVFNSAITRKNRLQVPEGKYYLVDNKYPNVPGFIAPYPRTPYHSKDFPSGYHPQDACELFNQRHSLLRNVTARTFGALKARFPILMAAPSYPLQTQVKLVVAACALHNYIRGEKPDDWIFKMYEKDTSFTTEESLPPLELEIHVETQNQYQGLSFNAEEIALASQLGLKFCQDLQDIVGNFPYLPKDEHDRNTVALKNGVKNNSESSSPIQRSCGNWQTMIFILLSKL